MIMNTLCIFRNLKRKRHGSQIILLNGILNPELWYNENLCDKRWRPWTVFRTKKKCKVGLQLSAQQATALITLVAFAHAQGLDER